jgi:hypothetical protein
MPTFMANYPFLFMQTPISSLVRFYTHLISWESPSVTSPPKVFTFLFIIISVSHYFMNNHNPVFISGVFNGITQDLLLWVFENRPPANILLISSDDSFSRFLHDLSMQGFNTLLSAPSTVDASFTAAANTFWHWPTLISHGTPLNAIEQVTFKI